MFVSFSPRGPLRNQWHAVARSNDVQREAIAVELSLEHLVLWRGPSGRVVAAPDRCSHRIAKLSPGRVEDGCLICPDHGRAFGDDGRCVNIPRRDVIDESAHLVTYGCEERCGLVWVCTGDPRSEIPTVAIDGDPAFRRVNAPPITWDAPAPRIVEALLEQGFADGSKSGFDVPFTYRRSIPTHEGSDALLLVTCSPLGATTSRVFAVCWSDDASRPCEDLLDAELTAIAALKPTVEAVSGAYEIDEDDPDDGTVESSAWRRALLEAMSS
jgi:phenylpropionate dioxygenase-like ring-hydroxylating dioxygenase large terminal subunit